MRLPWHQPRPPVARPMPAFTVPVLHPQVRFDIAPVARRLQQRNIHEYQPVDAVVEVGIDAKIDELHAAGFAKFGIPSGEKGCWSATRACGPRNDEGGRRIRNHPQALSPEIVTSSGIIQGFQLFTGTKMNGIALQGRGFRQESGLDENACRKFSAGVQRQKDGAVYLMSGTVTPFSL